MTKETKTSVAPLKHNELENPEQTKIINRLMSGSENEDFTTTMFKQIFGGLWLYQGDQADKDTLVSAMFSVMRGSKPKDELEGMLIAQMIALHNASMECLRRAMLPNQEFEVRQASLSQANKLSRSYTALFDTLGRYRGKGVSEQKVTVEHVHVYEGGQAIVGNVEKEKKSENKG